MSASLESDARSSVTVVLVAFNHERFVYKALEAAFAQTYVDVSILIFDDASSDGTAQCISDYLNETKNTATFVRHEFNRGLCATLNEALFMVDSDYIAIIAADDWMEPNRIAEQVEVLDSKGPEYGFAYSDAAIVDVDGCDLGTTFISANYSFDSPPSENIFSDILRQNSIPAAGVLIRRAVFETVGNYDEEIPVEDYDMWLRISREFKVVYTPGCLVNYRAVPGSMTHLIFVERAREARLGKIRMYKKHLGLGLDSDLIVIGHLRHLVTAHYLSGEMDSATKANLRLIAKKNPRASTLLYTLLAQIGVSGAWITALRQALRYPPKLKDEKNT